MLTINVQNVNNSVYVTMSIAPFLCIKGEKKLPLRKRANRLLFMDSA